MNSAVVTSAHSPSSSLNSVRQTDAAVPSYVTVAGSEHYAPAQVLYAVGHRSPHDASSSPVPADASPRAPSQLSPADGSPHWFAHSPSPPTPRLGDVVASGELSPAHATALQQRFQQFSMASSRTLHSSPVVIQMFVCTVITVLLTLWNL